MDKEDCRAAPDRKVYDSRISGRTNKGAGATIQFRHRGESPPEMARRRCANIAPVMVFLYGVKIGGAGRIST